MNLASRCREGISHIAMLKKELALQQKRTAQALASQREQTKRMADNLTSSFISFSSQESGEPKNQNNNNGNHHNVVDEDESVLRLVSSTPSPNRDGSCQSRKGTDDTNSNSPLDRSMATTTSASSPNTRSSVSLEHPQDTTATTAIHKSKNELDSFALASSTLSEKPGETEITQKTPALYSTPKKNGRVKPSTFDSNSDNNFDDTEAEKSGFFPFSASPKVSNKSKLTLDNKSYDEGFPSDAVDGIQVNNIGNHTKPNRKLDLLNSIDAFEQSFSTDFPDSFTPKEGNNNASSPVSGSGQTTYNPFFPTPEKPKSPVNSIVHGIPKEESNSRETSEASQKLEFKTPPKNAIDFSSTNTDENDRNGVRPKRPEKTIPSTARARYEKVLAPRAKSSTQINDCVRNEEQKNSPSACKSTGTIFGRKSQRRQLGKNLDSTENDSKARDPILASPSSRQKRQPHEAILNIVDTFEQTIPSGISKEQKTSTPPRFQGPIKSLRRRSVKKPISYAEPPLNTKLRRGDTFFPKTSPNMTNDDDCNGRGDQNQVPNLIKPAAVVSP